MSMRPDDHRRKWDKDEFEKIAAERLQAELDEDEKAKKKSNNNRYLSVQRFPWFRSNWIHYLFFFQRHLWRENF